MRTTLTLDEDNAIRLERLRKKRDASFKEVVNEALRSGLDRLEAPPERRAPFQTKVFDAGGLIDPSKSIKDILKEMDEEYDMKKLGLGRGSD